MRSFRRWYSADGYAPKQTRKAGRSALAQAAKIDYDLQPALRVRQMLWQISADSGTAEDQGPNERQKA